MPRSPSRRRLIRPPVLGCLLCVLLLTCGGAEPRTAGPPVCRPGAGPPPCLPPVPEKPSPTGKEAVSAFVDGLRSSDAAFEVLLGQGRILTTKVDILAPANKPQGLIAIADPTVIAFAPITARQIKVIGLRLGVTDVSIRTPEGGVYTFEVRVVADLDVLRLQLHCLFPDASLKLTQVRDQIVVEGQARDSAQVVRIMETIRGYFASIQRTRLGGGGGGVGGPTNMPPAPEPTPMPMPVAAEQPDVPPAPGSGASAAAGPGAGGPGSPVASGGPASGTAQGPLVINLIKVPGSQQVLLKVRVAELNRTGMRQIGADFLTADPILGTQIGGAGVTGVATAAARSLTGTASTSVSPSTTLFGIFEPADFSLFFSALRKNSLLKILAEPNLVALNGQAASFLAGGEFPVPVPQTSSGGAAPTVTVLFKEFGVRLDFLPHILDGDVIRLTVDPEVSSIDFSIGTVLVPGGTPVPGLNSRKAHTVVEMRQGQTLAIAGLLQLSLDSTTSRIPGLGDLAILGPFFQNTTGTRVEKELVVLVTPYLIEPMNPGQVPPTPGDEVNAPTDLEFYLLHRIEGHTGVDWRATTQYPQPDPLSLLKCLFRVEDTYLRGPHGFCE